MFLTLASFKGGVSKTTSSVHLAAVLQERGPTMLCDGDPNRSASGWARRGELPFEVVDERVAPRRAREFAHVIIDTAARPEEEDMRALCQGCDLLIIPTTPDALALDALLLTVKALQKIGATNYRILLAIVPPKPSRDGEEARRLLEEQGLPLFTSEIPRLAALQKAALQGKVVRDVDDPRAQRAWEHYVALGEEILRA